jgi:hypothetical protein
MGRVFLRPIMGVYKAGQLMRVLTLVVDGGVHGLVEARGGGHKEVLDVQGVFRRLGLVVEGVAKAVGDDVLVNLRLRQLDGLQEVSGM